MNLEPTISGEDLHRHIYCHGLRAFIGIHITDGRIMGADLSKMLFFKCTFMNVEFESCNLNKALFLKCKMYGCTFNGCDINEAVFDESILNVRLTQCECSRTSFKQSTLSNGFIRQCLMSEMDFSQTKINGTWADANTICNPPKNLDTVDYFASGATEDEAEDMKRLFIMGITNPDMRKVGCAV